VVHIGSFASLMTAYSRKTRGGKLITLVAAITRVDLIRWDEMG